MSLSPSCSQPSKFLPRPHQSSHNRFPRRGRLPKRNQNDVDHRVSTFVRQSPSFPKSKKVTLEFIALVNRVQKNPSEKIKSETINDVLNRLKQATTDATDQSDSIGIARTWLHIEKLAESNQLIDPINASTVNDWLKLLARTNPKEQAIAMMIYNLGLLSRTNKLEGTINGESLDQLINLLINTNPTEQAISNTIYGLGLLVKANKLEGTINGESLDQLINLLINTNPTEQAIFNAIYSLGLLAKANQLKGTINGKHLNNLIDQTINKNISKHIISNIIYSLGALAKANNLVGTINDEHLNRLMDQLVKVNPNPVSIRCAVWGIVNLAKFDKLTPDPSLGLKAINKTLLDIYMTQSQSNSTQDTISLLFALVNTHRMKERLWDLSDCSETMVSLVEMCMSQASSGRLITSIRLFIVCLYLHEKSELSFTSENILKKHLYHLYNRLNHVDLQSLEYFQLDIVSHLEKASRIFGQIADETFPGWSYHQNDNFDEQTYYQEDITPTTQHTQDNLGYITPTTHYEQCDIRYIATTTQHTQDYLEDKSPTTHHTQDDLEDITPTTHHTQDDLENIAPTKQQTWQKSSESDFLFGKDTEGPEDVGPEEVRSSVKRTQPTGTRSAPEPGKKARSSIITRKKTHSISCDGIDEVNDPIFQCINQRDEESLIKLLSLPTSSPLPSTTTMPQSTNSTQVSRDRHTSYLRRDNSNNDTLVKQFFTMVDARKLQFLVASRNSTWFVHLIRACSISQRYALAHQHLLYVVIKNLKPASLTNFVRALIGEGCSLHVNHQAVIALIDNLADRATESKDHTEQELIKKLQLKILDKAIQFHSRHKHVMTTLQTLREKCCSGKYTLVDENDEAPIHETTPPLSARSVSAPIVELRQERLSDLPPLPSAPSSSSSDSQQVPYIRTDGNCLYNSIAVGLRQSQAALKTCYAICKRFGIDHQLLDGTCEDFVNIMTRLPAYNAFGQDIQTQFSPLLRTLACVYLKEKRLQWERTVYIPTDHNIAALFLQEPADDYMGLSEIAFIQTKVGELLNGDFSLNVLIERFKIWWASTGEEAYLNFMSTPADSEHGRSRWGSEIELGALCDCLGMTAIYQHGATLGYQEGMFSEKVLQEQYGLTFGDLELLKRFSLVEDVCYFDSTEDMWVKDGLRFKPGALEKVNLLGTFPTYKSSSGDIVNVTLNNIKGAIIAIDASIKRSKKSVSECINMSSRYGPQFLRALEARAIIVDGAIITDGYGQYDYERIKHNIGGLLSSPAQENLMKLLKTEEPLFAAIHESAHWVCQ